MHFLIYKRKQIYKNLTDNAIHHFATTRSNITLKHLTLLENTNSITGIF